MLLLFCPNIGPLGSCRDAQLKAAGWKYGQDLAELNSREESLLFTIDTIIYLTIIGNRSAFKKI